MIESDFLRTPTREAHRLTCFCKVPFETEAAAYANLSNRRGKLLPVTVYKCPHCNKFHYTSSETRVPESKRKN